MTVLSRYDLVCIARERTYIIMMMGRAKTEKSTVRAPPNSRLDQLEAYTTGKGHDACGPSDRISLPTSVCHELEAHVARLMRIWMQSEIGRTASSSVCAHKRYVNEFVTSSKTGSHTKSFQLRVGYECFAPTPALLLS